MTPFEEQKRDGSQPPRRTGHFVPARLSLTAKSTVDTGHLVVALTQPLGYDFDLEKVEVVAYHTVTFHPHFAILFSGVSCPGLSQRIEQEKVNCFKLSYKSKKKSSYVLCIFRSLFLNPDSSKLFYVGKCPQKSSIYLHIAAY